MSCHLCREDTCSLCLHHCLVLSQVFLFYYVTICGFKSMFKLDYFYQRMAHFSYWINITAVDNNVRTGSIKANPIRTRFKYYMERMASSHSLPPGVFSLSLVSHGSSVLEFTPTHLCSSPPCSRVHPQLLTRPLLLSDPQKISSHLSKTLHYYSSPGIPVTERLQSTRYKCKKHTVKINSVYRLGAHEMEIAGAV